MKTRTSNLIWGLFFIILGVGFGGNVLFGWDFNIFFPGWWSLFIILPCVISLTRNGFQIMPVIGVCFGGLVLLSSNGLFPGHLLWKLFWPLIFIVIGVSILFRNKFQTAWNHDHADNKWEDKHINWDTKNEKVLDYTATFSGQKISFDNEVFNGASLNAIFGGVELRLDNAIINSDVAITCSATFGGIDIRVPSDVNVKVIHNCVIFGGVDNKTRTRSWIQGAPTIYINANCMFGGIDVK